MTQSRRLLGHCGCCAQAASFAAAGISRRGLLAGAAALATGASMARSPTPAAAQGKPHRINVHHHLMPPSLVERMKGAGIGNALQFTWTVERSLDDMEKSGTAVSILSLSLPAVSFLAPDEARAGARDSNDYAAKLMADHPGRFGAFATLPMPYVEESLKEIEYALDTLKLDGVCVLTSYGDKWIGDDAFAPVLAELERRRAVTFVHPNLPACCAAMVPNVPPPVIEYGTDTARAIASLVFGGASLRCPNLKFIFTHAGGSMPMFMDRFTSIGISNPRLKDYTPEKVLAELRRFHYDTALAANAPAMAAIRNVAPVSQLLFGTDYPLRGSDYQADGLQPLFSAAELKAIERDNALRLLPRLRGI
jgi:predicted TIM-barrel fold metal-dependent hydrolase